MFWGRLLGRSPASPSPDQENLDRPFSNFDIAGVPTKQWSSGFFEFYQNLVPSCLLSCFCPCLLFAQVVIRAQIPFFIALKNSFSCIRGVSGCGFFFDIFLWLIVLIAGSIFLVFSVKLPAIVKYFFALLGLICIMMFLFINGHLRTAFRMKYQLPGMFPEGSEFWDCIMDGFLGAICLPCSLSQMARHVFQYDRWDPKIGCFLWDPTILPPLECQIDRPALADEAGLAWVSNTRLPNHVDRSGRAQ